MRHVICVTGAMAAGKNAVSDILEKHGYACTDADKLVHQALADPAIQARVLAEFGKEAHSRGIQLTRADGSLDRRALGALLFSDKALLHRHEAILHPEVDARIDAFMEAHPEQDIVINATVLYKTPSMKKCSAILFVTAPLCVRFFRARRRDGMKSRHILARFWQQRNLFAKYKKTDADIYRVSNTGSIQALEKKIEAFLRRLDS
ncbi:MAG: dephospho-CoA kinase [Treponema sp.]|nr:dephospho-CoA kinase [Treponema sp.]